MRFFLWMAVAVLLGNLDAKFPLGKTFLLPRAGFIDGTILNFYFWHNGTGATNEAVSISFYNDQTNDGFTVLDIPALFLFDRDAKQPVMSDSFDMTTRKFLNMERKEQHLDKPAPSNGWWRVDVYKHDPYNLSVFFQGFWSGIRTFGKSLDKVKSIFVASDNIDYGQFGYDGKYPTRIRPLSVDFFSSLLHGDALQEFKLSFPRFPIGYYIDMSVVMGVTDGNQTHPYYPALLFKPDPGNEPTRFLKIRQINHQLHLSGNYDDHDEVVCNGTNGDLQHLRLARISNQTFSMSVLFNDGFSFVTCNKTIESESASLADHEFYIKAQHGAVLLNMDHNIHGSRIRLIKKDEEE